MSTGIITGRGALVDAIAALGHHGVVAVAVSDIEDFNGINDRHGRAGADGVLLAYERTLSGSLPRDALLARVGGDEYAIVLPNTTPENALILLEEIRSHLGRAEAVEIPEPLRLSIGVAARPPHAKEPDDLVAAAEQAMYRAKREGGDRVAMYVEEKMVLKSNYYTRASLDRLSKLSAQTGRTEASLLREALDSLLEAYRLP